MLSICGAAHPDRSQVGRSRDRRSPSKSSRRVGPHRRRREVCTHPIARRLTARFGHSEHLAKHSGGREEGNFARVGLAECGDNLDTTLRTETDTTSATSRLLPIPGGPTTPTTAPLPRYRARPCTCGSRSLRGHGRRASTPRVPETCFLATDTSRRAGTGSTTFLIRTISGSPISTTLSTRRAVEALSITPPGGRRTPSAGPIRRGLLSPCSFLGWSPSHPRSPPRS